MTTTPTRPIDPVLFVDDDPNVALRGARCSRCATVTFPMQPSCPRCGRGDEPRGLAEDGVLWSYTVQSFAPKKPFLHTEPFTPFGVGYIDLGDVIVESRLTVNDPESLEIGMPMRLCSIVNHVDDDGTEVVTFAFAPSKEETA
ncbi:DNA-binding protein [Rhodococcus sp. IITR03]|nr:DNA-binding protein [Rhodococcus sp. IITR03]